MKNLVSSLYYYYYYYIRIQQLVRTCAALQFSHTKSKKNITCMVAVVKWTVQKMRCHTPICILLTPKGPLCPLCMHS